MNAGPAALGRRSAILVAGTWAATALGFLAMILTARRLGPQAVGALGFGFGVVGVIASLLLPGLAQAHVKRVAEGQDVGRCVATMLILQTTLQAVQLIALVAVAHWAPALLPAGVPASVVVALLLAQVLTSIAGAFTGAFLALEIGRAHV